MLCALCTCLRGSDEHLPFHHAAQTLVATTTIDASIRIRYNDVYNVVRRLKIERARKDPEGQQSCQLWVQELEKEGWDARMLESFEPGGPAGARSSAWAIFLLSQAGKEVSDVQESSAHTEGET